MQKNEFEKRERERKTTLGTLERPTTATWSPSTEHKPQRDRHMTRYKQKKKRERGKVVVTVFRFFDVEVWSAGMRYCWRVGHLHPPGIPSVLSLAAVIPSSLLRQTRTRPRSRSIPRRCGVTGWWPHHYPLARA